jgi:hypothetical protein
MFITVRKLKDHGACDEQVEIFEKHWPKGTEVTEKVLRKAHRINLTLSWFAADFLSNVLYRRFHKSLVPHVYEEYPKWKLSVLHTLIAILCPKKVK